MDFAGKNILVVGGSSGIGLAAVQLFCKNRATVYNVSRTDSAEWPDNVHHFSFDVLEDISALAALLPDKLHGLVYSVGSINLKSFNRFTEDDFITDYRLNVVGAAKVIQQCLKPLKNTERAAIVLISSVAAKAGMAFHTSVAAAKSGVEGLALSLAAELAFQNIRVNVIAPSLTDTPLSQHLLNTPEKKAAAAKRHPLGKTGTADEIAAAIAYLVCDDSAWITGQVFGIDGGLGTLKI